MYQISKEKESAPKKDDKKPILFTSGLDFSTKKKDEESKTAPVYLKFVEANLLKIKTPKDTDDKDLKKESEMSEFQKQYNIQVNKDDIKVAPIFKNNYLPEENVVEINLPVNFILPSPSFELVETLLKAIIQKAKTGSKFYEIKLDDENSFDFFVGACVLELDDLAMFIYEKYMADKLTVGKLCNLMLLSLEYKLPEVGMKLYCIFREYIIYREGVTDKYNDVIKKIVDAGDGAKLIYDTETFGLYEKQELLFSWNTEIFKKIFESFKKRFIEKFYKPEMRYYVLKILRQRNTNDQGELIWDNPYPHRYYMKYDHKDETIVSAIRHSEHSVFYIFAGRAKNEMPFGTEYLGCVEPNYWGTVFDIWDLGMDEKSLAKLPKYFGFIRAKIATITYETNIMGEQPRNFGVSFFDFLEKKQNKLDSMKPHWDAEKDCYTLNFYGRAKKASARNFILLQPENPDEVILMHGKVGKDEFNLDFRHPLNFMQSFGISLISIGKKFAVA